MHPHALEHFRARHGKPRWLDILLAAALLALFILPGIFEDLLP
jgi:hypothetical protein